MFLDNPFLHDLTPEQYELLAALFEPRTVPAKSPILKQGEPAVYLYILIDGEVKLQYKPHDGPRITLTRLHRGDVFGWSAVVGNAMYTSDAIGTTDVKLLRVHGEALRRLCNEYPTAGRSILEKLARAVSPRWIHAQQQVQSILRAKVFPEI